MAMLRNWISGDDPPDADEQVDCEERESAPLPEDAGHYSPCHPTPSPRSQGGPMLDPDFWDRTSKEEREVILRSALLIARAYRWGAAVDYKRGGQSQVVPKREILSELASETLKRIQERWQGELNRRQVRRKVQPIRGA